MICPVINKDGKWSAWNRTKCGNEPFASIILLQFWITLVNLLLLIDTHFINWNKRNCIYWLILIQYQIRIIVIALTNPFCAALFVALNAQKCPRWIYEYLIFLAISLLLELWFEWNKIIRQPGVISFTVILKCRLDILWIFSENNSKIV